MILGSSDTSKEKKPKNTSEDIGSNRHYTCLTTLPFISSHLVSAVPPDVAMAPAGHRFQAGYDVITPSVPSASVARAGVSFPSMPFMREEGVGSGVGANMSTGSGNHSALLTGSGLSSHDDATWILTSAFIVFTMQSGFGLLESGSVSTKNEVSIMVKNAVDVVFGGLSYWMFGFGLSFGEDSFSNPFCGWGHFFVADTAVDFGWVYSKFFFQASFATTATTIVSGAMAERTKLEAYIIFSFVNTFVFCIPAHWVWARDGWLAGMGVIDIAGAGPVHLVGGVTGLVATLMLKPRHNRFKTNTAPPMGSPSNAILGMFMLWWGWLGFNCGSTFGISGLKWRLAARSAVATICSSIAGGITGLGISFVTMRRQFDVPCLINGVLSSLVSITALCALVEPWEAFVIGGVGAGLCLGSIRLLDKLHVDDPVGCVGVHAVSGVWGLLVCGLLTPRDVVSIQLFNVNVNSYGLFKGGGGYLLGVQTLGCVAIILWTLVASYLTLKVIELLVGLRVTPEQETLGADLVEHGVGTGDCTYDKLTNDIIWHKAPIRAAHSICDACELLQEQLNTNCNDSQKIQGEPSQGTPPPNPSCLLRHIERRQSRTQILTYHGVQEETAQERLQAYCSRPGTPTRTLGRRLTSRRTLTSLRQSVSRRMRTAGRRSRGARPRAQSVVADIEKQV